MDLRRSLFTRSALVRASLRKRLWLGAGAVALFLATVLASRAFGPSGSAGRSPAFGLDFIAFYTGGTFVNEGRYRDLFDLKAVQAFQRDLARRHGVELGNALGPWWNPPFYAWVFAPLARLSFPAATKVWIGINVTCTAGACWLLVRMLPSGCGWRSWALVPVGIGLSIPFILSVTHGQNSGTSLLTLAAVVTAWRAGRGYVAGLAAGLLFYKPQLAAVLSAMLVVSLGWRALLGLTVTGSALLAVTLVTMPGSLGDFLHRMPANVHFVQVDCVYLWERHVTFKAFWRLLLQGNAAGEASGWVIALTAASMAAAAVALVRASPAWRWVDPFAAGGTVEGNGAVAGPGGRSRDGLIAATVAMTPLLMPFYFDYDLLLLAVPAVLVAADVMHRDPAAPQAGVDRWLLGVWPALYGWMLINADVAERWRVNLAVPLLAGVASLLVARMVPRAAAVKAEEASPLASLARAA